VKVHVSILLTLAALVLACLDYTRAAVILLSIVALVDHVPL
jgi:hypothetical protein